MGPKSNVKFLRKVSLRDAKTKRLINLSSLDCETGSSHVSCSYVAMASDEHSPTFAQIKTLFEHHFLINCTLRHVLNAIQSPVKIPTQDYGMCQAFVIVNASYQSELSPPLLIAIETSPARVWFLNY